MATCDVTKRVNGTINLRIRTPHFVEGAGVAGDVFVTLGLVAVEGRLGERSKKVENSSAPAARTAMIATMMAVLPVSRVR